MTGRFSDYAALLRPRVAALVTLTTAAGFWLGSEGPAETARGLLAAVAVTLVAGGAAALNQVVERREDALMRRTRERPVASGRLPPRRAAFFGVACLASGLGALLAAGMPLAALLSALTAALYLGVYTPMKRRSPFNTLVGALPGAMPPVLGWAAASGSAPAEAWLLFAILFLWQLPHFMAIAWIYREDYARAGFRMLTVEGKRDAAGFMAARQAVGYALALLPVSLLPALWGRGGLGGMIYFWGALALGAALVGTSGWFLARRTDFVARALLRVSVFYLPGLFALMAFHDRSQG